VSVHLCTFWPNQSLSGRPSSPSFPNPSGNCQASHLDEWSSLSVYILFGWSGTECKFCQTDNENENKAKMEFQSKNYFPLYRIKLVPNQQK
jgi:hypothetical protein